MSAEETVRALWERIEARDWEGARALLAQDMVCRWPHSDERFEGADAFVAMNRAYPEGWRIAILGVWPLPDGAVSRVRVEQADLVFHAASFFSVRAGRIAEALEYWVTIGQERPPQWRAAFATRPFE